MAALSHTLVLDTSRPLRPEIIGGIIDPSVTLHHQSDPVTVDGREFLIVNDELNGAAGNGYCPGGGLHVYDITGDLERSPVKVGAFFAPDINVQEGAPTGTAGLTSCTAHVFDIYEKQGLLTIAWFAGGVRVVDLSDLVGVSAGADPTGSVGAGMKEVGHFRFVADHDTWAAKVNKFARDGSAYIFSNDQTRGLDVFRYDSAAPKPSKKGRWMTPAQALERAERLRADPDFDAPDSPVCVIG